MLSGTKDHRTSMLSVPLRLLNSLISLTHLTYPVQGNQAGLPFSIHDVPALLSKLTKANRSQQSINYKSCYWGSLFKNECFVAIHKRPISYVFIWFSWNPTRMDSHQFALLMLLFGIHLETKNIKKPSEQEEIALLLLFFSTFSNIYGFHFSKTSRELITLISFLSLQDGSSKCKN